MRGFVVLGIHGTRGRSSVRQRDRTKIEETLVRRRAEKLRRHPSQKFGDQLELMSLSQRRSRADTDKLTPGELTQLRGVSGCANWLGNQTRPDLCVCTSLLQGAHASATVAVTHVKQTNSFACVDSTHTCQFESPRFLWTI